MYRPQLIHCLKLAFFPVIACILLAGHASGQTPTRIMPLGDSITGSPGCWRAFLWNQLQDDGYSALDFVGTLPTQGCGQAHDGDNEGHGGILATNMANANQLVSWLDATNADIVLMHLGTNDAWSNRSTAAILSAFDTLVNQMRANNPAMIILVAQIIPMDSARSCSSCAQNVIALNNALPAWVAGITSAASPVLLVDQWTGFNTDNHTYDGVHPNAAGDQLIADNWFDALRLVLDGSVTSSSSSSVSSNSASSVSSSAGAQQCNWYGTLYPLCVTTQSGWGWEQNRSCIARSTCESQPAPYGIVGDTAASSSSLNSVSSSSSTTSSSSSSSVVASSSSSSITTGGNCVHVVTNEWSNGFTGAIRITNNGSAPVSGWSVSWSYTDSTSLTNSWNAAVSGTNPYIATNLGWNGNIQPGQSVEFGFQATKNGNAPHAINVSGNVCE
jgi:lysophospholipase L1-like esterase